MQKPITRLIQVTDTHLFANIKDKLVGMNCEEGLQDVLALIREHETNPDVLLFTGDASQDNSKASYQRLELALGSLQIPQFWVPGNHDELRHMKDAVGENNACFVSSFAIAGWRILMLNSSVSGEVHGKLGRPELDFLQRILSECKEEHVMVCLHHNPVPVAANWLQQHCLKNPDELFAVLDADDRIRVVLFGHIHHDLSVERNGVLYMGSPSTCIQFHPTSFDFALDHLNPGYRWIDLNPDGTINTGIRRVSGKQYNIDFSGIGY